MGEINKENVIVESNKQGKALTVAGIIFMIIGAILGGICFFEVINALITNNTLGLALLILVFIIYGSFGLLASVISLVLNVLAYKKSIEKKRSKLVIMILSIIVLMMIITSFIIWVIAAKV